MEIKSKTFKYSIYSIIEALEKEGEIKDVFTNSKDSSKSDIYGGNSCLEISPLTNIIEKPLDMFPILPGRGNHFIMQLAEIIWVLNGKKNISEFFGQFASSSVQKFSHDTDDLYAAYGYRLRNQPEGNDILKYIINTLKKKNSSRSAVFPIFNAYMDTMGGEHKPCATTFQLHLYKNKLDGILTLRANDLIKGYSAINFQEFAFIQALVAYILNIEVGRFINFTSTMHYYTGEARNRIENIKKFKNHKTPNLKIGLNDWFNKEIIIPKRTDSIYSDFENIYENLKSDSNGVHNLKLNHPIFKAIYKVLKGYKYNTPVKETFKNLPQYIALPFLENMHRNNSQEVEEIIKEEKALEMYNKAFTWRKET